VGKKGKHAFSHEVEQGKRDEETNHHEYHSRKNPGRTRNVHEKEGGDWFFYKTVN